MRSTDVFVPIGAAVVVVALLLLGWLIARRVARSRTASRSLATARQASRGPQAQPVRRLAPSAGTADAATPGSHATEPNGTRLPDAIDPMLPAHAVVGAEPLPARAEPRRIAAAEPVRRPFRGPVLPEPTDADWTGEGAQPSAEFLSAPKPAEITADAEQVDLEPGFDVPSNELPDTQPIEATSGLFADAEVVGAAERQTRTDAPPAESDTPPAGSPEDMPTAAPADLEPVEAGPPTPETVGSGTDVPDAVRHTLAARALAGQLSQPTAPAGLDPRDRLLAVLLDNPREALGAAAELDGHREQLAQLSDALARQEEQLRAVVAKLAAAGLASDQVARLAKLSQTEVERLLEQGGGQ